MDVNDDVDNLTHRGALRFMLAPTGNKVDDEQPFAGPAIDQQSLDDMNAIRLKLETRMIRERIATKF